MTCVKIAAVVLAFIVNALQVYRRINFISQRMPKALYIQQSTYIAINHSRRMHASIIIMRACTHIHYKQAYMHACTLAPLRACTHVDNDTVEYGNRHQILLFT